MDLRVAVVVGLKNHLDRNRERVTTAAYVPPGARMPAKPQRSRPDTVRGGMGLGRKDEEYGRRDHPHRFTCALFRHPPPPAVYGHSNTSHPAFVVERVGSFGWVVPGAHGVGVKLEWLNHCPHDCSAVTAVDQGVHSPAVTSRHCTCRS